MARYGEVAGRLEVGGRSGSFWWREIAKIRDGGVGEEGGWFGARVSKVIGDGKNTFFWRDTWLGDVPLRRRFGRLFDLATTQLITVADMFELGWEEGARRGGGGEGCGRGKKNCWWSVDNYLLVFLCRLILLTGGSGIQTFMKATR